VSQGVAVCGGVLQCVGRASAFETLIDNLDAHTHTKDRQTDKQTDKYTPIQIDKKIDRQTD